MFLTGTTNIQAGNGETFTLDSAALAVIAGAIDPYFAEVSVHKEVICLYQAASSLATRPQRKAISFKGGVTSDQMIFSVKAQPGTWELLEVLIKDYDGGELLIAPSQIPNRSSYELFISSAI